MDYSENSRRYKEYLKQTSHLIDNNRETTYWGNIPVRSRFLRPLHLAYKSGMRFVDLGCGAGNVLRFAHNIGYQVTGVEIDGKFIEYIDDFEWYITNMEDLEPAFYKRFDVIYSYLPIKEGKQQYLDKIVTHMNVGSFILTPDTHIKDKRLIRLEEYFYKRI